MEYEFDVANELANLDCVASVTPMVASEAGFETSQDIDRRYRNRPFSQRFDVDRQAGDDEYPVAYHVSLVPPEETNDDFAAMLSEVEGLVRTAAPYACIGGVDEGVPAGDWSGWEVDPVITVLCVRENMGN